MSGTTPPPPAATNGVRIVVITGMAGAGKSTGFRALEDAGFFCIDNLPAVLLPKMTELAGHAGSGIPNLAVVIDARDANFLSQAPRMIDEARRAGHTVEVVFLDAKDEVLIRRFSETRRRHPLSPEGTVIDGIARERERLLELKRAADSVIDTSTLTVHELRALLSQRYATRGENELSVTVLSFGYRYGMPPQADLVFDVRFLPNPFFIEELRPFTGTDPRVARYVLEREESQDFLGRVLGMCEFLLPRYRREGKSYVTVALGCTGGKHRSVAMGEALAAGMIKFGVVAGVWHRDKDKE
jgi:UPF0042 nucleotide-binding protein